MNLDSPTLWKIYAAELERSGSPTRVFGRALALMGFLVAVASGDKRPLRVAEAIY